MTEQDLLPEAAPTRPEPTFLPSWTKGQCAVADAPWLRFIHDCYIGPQNKVDDEYSYMGTPEKPYPFRVDLSKPVTTEIIPMNGTSTRYSASVGYGGNKEEGPAVGITNVRLRCLDDPTFSEQDIRTLYLEVGGQWFDKAYANAMGSCVRVEPGDDSSAPTFRANIWMLQEGRVLPFAAYHMIQFTIDLAESSQGRQFELLYDLVTIQDVSTTQLNKGVDFPTCMWQFTGMEDNLPLDTTTGRYRMKCNFNHPLLDLHLRTETPIQAARLVLNRHLQIPFTYSESTGNWSIMFSPFQGTAIGNLHTTLNASRIDYLTIEMEPLDGKDPGETAHWARTLHPARIMRGMMGLMWSK